ncbi:MAG: translational GTPase TypA [Gemmatales bacterium]|nr:translational GTPase TypA [Gemmatales bacterium]MDW8176849.1 translational GTPase TypA [Gemmatales bacterium]
MARKPREDLRNVAIIAHVDHGKTTLVDQLLRQCGLFREGELRGECILDSHELERERGITILAKNIALHWQGVKINLIDTPGHADFGGEVERVLRLADGVLLLVDAAEGPLPQTRFVLRKAFEYGLRPVVVINKMDRAEARPQEVYHQVFDLFVALGAEDLALDFPVVYASGRQGWASWEAGVRGQDIRPIFQAILQHIPAPVADADAPLQMQVVHLDFSEYLGRLGVGRIYAGRIRRGQPLVLLKPDGRQVCGRVEHLFVFDRLGRVETDLAEAGDICAVGGVPEMEIGDTLADPHQPLALPPLRVEEPTLDMIFRSNDSPFAGREGLYVTSRQIRERLLRELEHNVALRVRPGGRPDEFIVSGRGLLHLAVLIETMRREGFELSVGKPQVILREHDGQRWEPVETLIVEVPPEHVGTVMELLGSRRAECVHMEMGRDLTRLEFTIPARGLIGLRTRLMTATGGTAQFHHTFLEYQPFRGTLPGRSNGVMISTQTGTATAYAIENLQERGVLFVEPGEAVYEGQIVGEHCRDNDLPVNICRERKLTNVRASTAEKTVVLKPPRRLTLEMALEYIEDDEFVEVTPRAIRLRKIHLQASTRKRLERQNAWTETWPGG